MSEEIQMPRYKCHKEVSALKIKSITSSASGVVLEFEDPGFAPMTMGFEWQAKHKPQPGWYLVIYDGDGYTSCSPAKAFEDGYTRI